MTSTLRPLAPSPNDEGDRAAGSLKIFLLGAFRIDLGDRIVLEPDWRLRKAAAAVKILALSPGQSLLRDQLIECLWSDLAPQSGGHNLNQALYVARRMLRSAAGERPRLLYRQGDQVRLCSDGPVWVDVDAFREATNLARRDGDPQSYRAALALYEGDLLPADLYEEWSLAPRDELRDLHRNLLLGFARLLEERGSYEEAVEALQAVLREDAALEVARLGLMRLHARHGHRRRALREFKELSEALLDELGIEPSPAARTLHEEILSGEFPAAPTTAESPPVGSSVQHNLPALLTSFVGRRQELREIRRHLAAHRLVTMIGSAGSGKTRLAIESAKDLLGHFSDGIWLAELAPLTDLALIPESLARTMRIPEVRGQPAIETLVNWLRTRRALLVLDNCEHLISACATVAERLLRECPELRILATSREPLHVAGERLYQVPTLDSPDPRDYQTTTLANPDRLLEFDAIRLFIDRARLVRPDFTFDRDASRSMAIICHRLDGMPLAIELAAARTNVLGVDEIARRLDDRFKLLTVGPRTASDRHQTLRAAIEWSYELLSDEERDFFNRLSVFAGGFTLRAAAAVALAGGDDEQDADALDLLTRLVEKSLVAVEHGEDDGPRYRLLETMRAYGREKLIERDELGAVRRQHALFYQARCERLAPLLAGGEQQHWHARLERELDNLRAALDWSLEATGDVEVGLRLAGSLWRFWWLRGHFTEGRARIEALLAHPEAAAPTAARAMATYALGVLIYRHADYDAGDQRVAHALFEECLAIYRRIGDDLMTAATLRELGRVAIELGEFEAARAPLDEALVIEERLGDRHATALTVSALAWRALFAGEYSAVQPLIDECLPVFEEAGDVLYIGISNYFLGRLYTDTGDFARAYAYLAGILERLPVLDYRWGIPLVLEGFARLAVAEGRHARALRLAGAAAGLREQINASLGPSWRHDLERRLLPAMEATGERAGDHWEEGRQMNAPEVVSYALNHSHT